MLKQARIEDIRKGRLTKELGHLVVVTRHYPRGLKRDFFHDFKSCLAPTKDLLDDFHDKVRELGGDHNAGFLAVEYAKKFSLDGPGWVELARYAERSWKEDVYLICHCKLQDRCHRELLLLLAERHFGAAIEPVRNSYMNFSAL